MGDSISNYCSYPLIIDSPESAFWNSASSSPSPAIMLLLISIVSSKAETLTGKNLLFVSTLRRLGFILNYCEGLYLGGIISAIASSFYCSYYSFEDFDSSLLLLLLSDSCSESSFSTIVPKFGYNKGTFY